MCDAAADKRVPGIDELGRLCFKDTYCACPVFLKRVAMNDYSYSGITKRLKSHKPTGISANGGKYESANGG